jgi:hypothetical protein
MAIQLSGFKSIAALVSQQSQLPMIATDLAGVKLDRSHLLRIMTRSRAYLTQPFSKGLTHFKRTYH